MTYNYVFMTILFSSLVAVCNAMEKNDTKKKAYFLTALGSGGIGTGYGIQSINKLKDSYTLQKSWGWVPRQKFVCKGGCGSVCNHPKGCPVGTSQCLFKQGIASGIKSSMALVVAFYAWKWCKNFSLQNESV